MKNIEKALSELYSYVEQQDQLNQNISTVNVGWHIEHSSLVIIKIIETVIQSDPSRYKWTFNAKRSLFFFLNKFPRGKAKAPEIVKPKQVVQTDFESLLHQTRNALIALQAAEPNQFFLHPIFGNLNKKDTFRMLAIHTSHHLHIIKDILSR